LHADDVDLLRGLFLASPLLEVTTARRTSAVRDVELVLDGLLDERRLGLGAVALRLWLGRGLWLGVGVGPALAGFAEERALALGEDLADAPQLGGDAGVVGLLVGELRFEANDGLAHLFVETEEAANLGVLGERGASEDVDSGLTLEVDHAGNLSHGRWRWCENLQRLGRWRERRTEDEGGAFEEERELGCGEGDGLTIVAPRCRESRSLDALGVEAEAGAVPQQGLGGAARAGEEEEDLAGERIAAEVGADDVGERVEALAHVDGARADEDAGVESL
jgi:hypothetical protein